jgi:uncharacterized protein YbjT (DUF2867 family)
VAIASIDPADIAAVAATVLADPGHEYTAPVLSGPQPLTPRKQVASLARILDRPLRYEPVPDEQARAEMLADTPAPIVDGFFRFFTEGEFDDSAVQDSVLAITGRAPRRLEDWARDHVSAFPQR